MASCLVLKVCQIDDVQTQGKNWPDKGCAVVMCRLSFRPCKTEIEGRGLVPVLCDPGRTWVGESSQQGPNGAERRAVVNMDGSGSLTFCRW
jgi:hypothetical protein